MMFPQVPNLHALGAMALTVLALWAFTRDRYPLEISSFGLLAVLAAGFAIFPFGDLKPSAFFYGLGHEALVAVCALMVVGQGLVVTGALEPIGRYLAKFWSAAPSAALFVTLILGGVLSAFVNNTPIVVLFLPILISVCLRTGSSASRILMPVGFATLVGGMATTIGTSTNLLVVSIAADLGAVRFSMFDFALPACIASLAGIAYLWLIAPRLLPDRKLELDNASPRLFVGRLVLEEGSPAIGGRVQDAYALTGDTMKILRIRRGDSAIVPNPDETLRGGDRLRVQDTAAHLTAYAQALGATLYSGDSSDQAVDETHPLSADDQSVAEIAVVQGSLLDRTNLKSIHFRDRYQLVVLALHRQGRDVPSPFEEIDDVVLSQGDVLLVQGNRDQIVELKRSAEFMVLDGSTAVPRTDKAPMAFAITFAVVTAAATGIMPIAVSATSGVLLMLLTGCLRLGSAIRAISPSVFFVVAASLALGKALIETGATDYIADVFLYATHGQSPVIILSALMLLLAILTNVISNNAAAVIGTPIAIGIATKLGLPYEPFILAVLFGANMSYATPMAYKTNLLVMSAGGYRFSDFVKVGAPLTIIMWLVLTYVLAAIYL